MQHTDNGECGLHKSYSWPGAMTLAIGKENHRYGPIYATRSDDETVEFSTYPTGVQNAIKVLDRATSQYMEMKDEDMWKDANRVTTVISMPGIQENHNCYEMSVDMTSQDENTRAEWASMISEKTDYTKEYLTSMAHLFYVSNGRGLECRDHLIPLLAAFIDRVVSRDILPTNHSGLVVSEPAIDQSAPDRSNVSNGSYAATGLYRSTLLS